MEEKTPVPVAPIAEAKPTNEKLGKLKLGLLYVLIGGLIVSALISVISILIGEFTEVAGKALLTTFILVTHSLLVIAIVSADRNNRLGKDLISTTILATVIANMFTATLGTWEIIPGDGAWRAFLVYMLVIGAAFIVTASLKLRSNHHKITNTLAYTTSGLLVLLTLLLVPWILIDDPAVITSFYYRLIGAVVILVATSLSITVIFNRIAAAQHHHIAKKPALALPGGMVAIYVTVGSIVALFWFYGFFGFLAKASTVDRPSYQQTHQDLDRPYRYR